MKFLTTALLIVIFYYLFPGFAFAQENDDVNAPSLNDDYTIITNMDKALLPESVYAATPTAGISIPPKVEIGVDQGFLLSIFKSFLCRFTSFGFCPVNLNLAAGQTDRFSQQARLKANSERPSQIIPTPATKDPHLSDIKDPQGKETQGNKALDQLDTSLAKQGVYSSDLPSQVVSVCDSPNSFFSSSVRPTPGNLALVGNNFKDDERAPRINCSQELFYRATYPKDIRPLAGN